MLPMSHELCLHSSRSWLHWPAQLHNKRDCVCHLNASLWQPLPSRQADGIDNSMRDTRITTMPLKCSRQDARVLPECSSSVSTACSRPQIGQRSYLPLNQEGCWMQPRNDSYYSKTVCQCAHVSAHMWMSSAASNLTSPGLCNPST